MPRHILHPELNTFIPDTLLIQPPSTGQTSQDGRDGGFMVHGSELRVRQSRLGTD